MKKFSIIGLITAILISCFTPICHADTLTESDLKQKIQNQTSKTIFKTFYEDYDLNGEYEMFAFVDTDREIMRGEPSMAAFYGDVWYADKNGAKKFDELDYVWMNRVEIMNHGDFKTLDYHYPGGDNFSYSVNNGQPAIEPLPQIKSFYNGHIGSKVGDVLYTDIKAYINDKQIAAYACDGGMIMVAEDLANYGFDVTWNGDLRSLYILRNKSKPITGMTVSINQGPTGAVYTDQLSSDVKVYLNGDQITTYAINGYSMVKLEDFAPLGTFTWDNSTRTAKLSFDTDSGYVNPVSDHQVTTPINNVTLSNADIDLLAEYCQRIPKFNSSTVNTKAFADEYLFYFYTGKPSDMSRVVDYNQFFAYNKAMVRDEFKNIFGTDMYDTDEHFDGGYYWIHASNFGDERYVFEQIIDTPDGVDVIFRHTDSENSDFGKATCHLIPADTPSGYIITSIQ